MTPFPDGSTRITGELVNTSGAAQTLFYISGTFFDDAGQITAEEADVSDYWPTDQIPPGGRLPFDLTVDSLAPIADYSLETYAEQASADYQSDFPTDNILQTTEDETYCVDGTVLFSPPAPSELVVILTGFNANNTVAEFDWEYLNPATDDTTAEFSVCVDDENSLINHHSLQIWEQ